MTEPLSPEILAWLRQSVSVDGSTYSRVLLHLLERVEVLEARYGATSPAPKPSPETAYDLSRQQATTQPPMGWLDQHGPPPAALAGGLVERVLRELPSGTDPSCARAAIRVVAAWLDRQGQHGCSLLLREEVDQ
jgi:hypothetical protein